VLASKQTMALRRQGPGPAATSTPSHLTHSSDYFDPGLWREVSEPNGKLFYMICSARRNSINYSKPFNHALFQLLSNCETANSKLYNFLLKYIFIFANKNLLLISFGIQ
jgi:hypothetical protein